MKDVGIADYSPELLEWLRKQTDDTDERPGNIGHHETDDQRLIDAFTVFQAFILGYYYGIVLSVVDTETLEFKSVDGGWGYRTGYGLNIIRTEINKAKPKTTSGMVVFGRQVILRISSLLLFSNDTQIAEITGTRWCLGVVGKRALLASSLIRGCHSPQDIGRFILLDVDVGGVPTSSDGLVRGGDGEYLEKDYVDETAVSISKYGGDEDFTRHIEPDWEGNPELMLLCIRYKGRRITTLNPAVADAYFCLAYLPPIPNPAADQVLSSAIYCGIDAFLAGKG
ncbi:hypothetical protein DIS24_g9665 [Lasiodiplodia hormozganensis]|uniref:Uncharacterized protein n=1 Tax=Lasiodiplodia hormozganensis TaxID=869390 RepID=A0AA39XV10_9PEZI|nr:hypothetical protein DIS24_g9665 [Lasiodiplodia hormozganensis]